VVSLVWERPDAPSLTLWHELGGARANLILVDAAGIIVDALQRVSATATQPRAVLPGCPYHAVLPPAPRVALSALTREHLDHLHQQGQFDASHLQRLIVGLSPVLAAELLHRSHGEPLACWELLQHLRHHYEQQTLSLTLCTLANGSRHLSVLPLTHAATAIEQVTDVQAAADALYQPLMDTAWLDTARRAAQKSVRQRQQKLRKKIDNLQGDYHKLQEYLSYQHYGTLLVAQRLPRGATSATVVDYYRAEPEPITIPLDPRLSAQDNAQLYFKKYRKAKHGMEKVRALLHQCTMEAQYLEELARQVDTAEDWHALASLDGERDAPLRPKQQGRERPQAASPLYRRFTSREGLTLYCGKSQQGNDALLRQLANSEDLWFHAYRQAGAHVLLKVPLHRDVTPQTLAEAAALAAFYSKGKDANAVEVMYTQAKHVRKFRGARPGQVQVATYHTIEVAPRLPDA
jgi:predicted ribosome quality control (RQC) complex YloA/Tae2 family protein